MESLFDKNMMSFGGVLNAINAYGHDYSYQFMDTDEFAELIPKNLQEANKIYVQELLFRSHIAAITTLLRNEKWMQGLQSALKDNNYFMFAASLRGLVESAADSMYCLIQVPGTIRDHFIGFDSALKGKFNAGLIICEQLEEILIHYSHGKKQPKGSSAPDAHFAKSSQEYLRALDDPNCTDVRDLYSELCEVTHPAERTVSIFITRRSENSQDHVINRDLDEFFIKDLLERHNRAFINVFQMSFNAALLSLYALNNFQDKRFYTPGMADVNMSKVPAFRELEKSMIEARKSTGTS